MRKSQMQARRGERRQHAGIRRGEQWGWPILEKQVEVVIELLRLARRGPKQLVRLPAAARRW